MELEPRHVVSAGITYSILHPDLVSPFEENSVRIQAGYTKTEWLAMSPRERATEVAMRRLIIRTELLMGDEQFEESKRRGKRR
jgi:hypothetical protein